MINNYTNINKTNNHISPQIIEHKKTMKREWLLYSANTTLIFQLSLQVHVLLYETMILPVLPWTNTMSYNRVEGWNFINRFDPTTLVCCFSIKYLILNGQK
jgi:hypothetical protein